MTRRILLVSDHQEHTVMLERALRSEGFSIVFTNDTALAGLPELALKSCADLVLIELEKPSNGVLENVRRLTVKLPLPVVLFVKESDRDSAARAIQAGVSAYVVDGLREDRIGPILAAAMAGFQETQALRQALRQAQTSLKERKLIERAKGLLMQQRGCSEDEAYTALRRSAMRQNRRLAEIAQGVIDAAALMS